MVVPRPVSGFKHLDVRFFCSCLQPPLAGYNRRLTLGLWPIRWSRRARGGSVRSASAYWGAAVAAPTGLRPDNLQKVNVGLLFGAFETLPCVPQLLRTAPGQDRQARCPCCHGRSIPTSGNSENMRGTRSTASYGVILVGRLRNRWTGHRRCASSALRVNGSRRCRIICLPCACPPNLELTDTDPRTIQVETSALSESVVAISMVGLASCLLGAPWHREPRSRVSSALTTSTDVDEDGIGSPSRPWSAGRTAASSSRTTSSWTAIRLVGAPRSGTLCAAASIPDLDRRYHLDNGLHRMKVTEPRSMR